MGASAVFLAVVFARPVAGQAAPTHLDREVRTERFTVVERVPLGARPAWSVQGDRLAYDAPDSARDDGLVDIFVLDQGARLGRCLTCAVPDLRKLHALGPSWHPSGKQLLFQTVALANKTGIGTGQLDTPARSQRGEIWLARVDGKDFWQLTALGTIGSAPLDPSFSFEGDRLVWAQRSNSRRGRYGAWRLESASLRMRRGVPSLSEERVEFEPEVPVLVIPHGFSPDDRGVLVSTHLEPGQTETGLDLYLVERGRPPRRLTRTTGSAEAFAQFEPRNGRITYTSEDGLERTVLGMPSSELWSMSADGTDLRRLTYFNDGAAPEYRGATWVGAFAWHPDGDRLAVQVSSGSNASTSLLILTWPATRAEP